MELSNDLVTIIATYSHWISTINLLSVAITTLDRLYDPNHAVWHHKATYEAQGLVHNSTLIDPVGWRYYYLLRNRHIFGDLYVNTQYFNGNDAVSFASRKLLDDVLLFDINSTIDIFESSPEYEYEERVIRNYIIVATRGGTYWTHSTVGIPSEQSSTFNKLPIDLSRAINIAAANSTYPGERFYVLLEDGIVYEYHNGDAFVTELIVGSLFVKMLVSYDENKGTNIITLLARDGTVVHTTLSGEHVIGTAVDIDLYGYYPYFVNSTGTMYREDSSVSSINDVLKILEQDFINAKGQFTFHENYIEHQYALDYATTVSRDQHHYISNVLTVNGKLKSISIRSNSKVHTPMLPGYISIIYGRDDILYTVSEK